MGGRWNSPGRSVVYMAESVSLAVLENLVHMAKEDFPTGYVVITAVLPDGIVVLTEEQLVAQLGHTDQKTLGDQWVDLRLSSVLAVRSKIVFFEHNYLLNPQHPDFRGITTEPPEEFAFNERLSCTRHVGGGRSKPRCQPKSFSGP